MLNRTTLPRFAAFLLFLFTFAAAAADLNVSIQPRNITVGMRGYVEISAENVSRLQLRQTPARVSGLEWNSGISSGSSMSVINGVTSSKYTLRIPFTAREEGEFTIPPIEVVVNGNSRQPEKTAPLKIRVSAMPKIDPAQASSNEPVYARMTFPGTDEDKTPTFWVGEEIPLQLSLFVRTPYELRLANYPEIKPVNSKMSIRFHDFRKINPEAPNFESVSSHNQRLGNIPYTVYDFDSKFRALAPGQLQLVADTNAVLLDERDFFSAFTSTRQVIRGASPTITIKPLPAAPADAPFIGLIGKWEPEASLSPGPYRIGEPLSLKINFTGEDQTEMLNMPKIEPEHFRAYPPETAETPSGISVSCILIPLEAGEQTVSFSCSTFDPASGKYIPFSFKQTIKVDKSASGGIASITAGAAVVNADPDLTSRSGATPAPESILYLHDENDGGTVTIPLAANAVRTSFILLLAGLLVAAGITMPAVRKRALESDPSARRRIDARARRGKLASAIEKTPPQDLPDKVGADLAAFFNDMLDLPPGTALGETASRVKESAPELGRQLEDLANTAWMPSLRSELNEKFRRQLASAVRKFGAVAFILGALFLALPASAAEEGSDAQSQDSTAPAEPAAQLPKTQDEAKTAYDAGQFRQALDYYASKIDPRNVSPALLYNMGNCFYQLGDYPRALVCYERARHLQPRNSDISGNLELTRRKLLLPPKYRVESPADFLLAARDFLRVDEWIVACAFGLMLVLIALGMFFRRRSNLWQWPFYTGIAIAVICTAALIAKASADDPAREAVVIVRNTPLYSLPSSESGRVEQYLKPGTEVSIEENRMDWVRVRMENNDEGWVRGANLALLWSNSPGDLAAHTDPAP
ncbi:MAG: BatD family protein [Lentisphaeria bacterium]|nr:BatD family protein [Lentisphaeria bacterium]